MEYRPLTSDLSGAAQAFASRIPERDRGFLDPFLLYQVAVASWTQPTPARRIAAIDADPGDSDAAEVVGLATVVPHSGWQSHVGEFRVVVQPSHRGAGIGGELIDRGVALAQQLSLRKLVTDVMASNASGIALFERHGFEREAVLTRHVRDGDGNLQDLVVLSHELEAAT